MEQSPVEDIDATLRINVLGPAALIQAALPLLRLGGGRIVNISSINAILPVPYAAAYNASKAALESLSDSLRLELQPWGIPVVVVRPAAFDTDVRTRGVEWWRHRRQELPPDEQTRYADGFEMQERFMAVLNSQAGHPDEVAETVHRALTDPEPQTKYSLGRAWTTSWPSRACPTPIVSRRSPRPCRASSPSPHPAERSQPCR